ncbi:MAG: hypothetical protein M3270_05730 [Thermoproteota archaeon]|nr:hypothetical protein [Thermoproteota archaeon]
MVDWDEEIKGHLFWVWGGEEGFFKRGKEGMLVVTNRRLAFITKTDMTYKMHETYSLRQLKRFEAGENVFRPAEGYTLEHLKNDVAKSPDNLQISFSQILDVLSEEKDWGTLLKVKVNLGYKTKAFKFSLVKGWVKYPAKDPLEFQRMDWRPLINLIKTSI